MSDEQDCIIAQPSSSASSSPSSTSITVRIPASDC
jgi:hypothetical protein